MSDLDPYADPWWGILFKFRSGERIEQQEVYDALAGPYPVTDDAKPFLLAVLGGEYKFRRGRKSLFGSYSPVSSEALAGIVDMLQSQILDHSINLSGFGTEAAQIVQDARNNADSGLIGAPTPREAAKTIVAHMYGISVRKLEDLISPDTRRIKK